jgi:hypothetical protein
MHENDGEYVCGMGMPERERERERERANRSNELTHSFTHT